MSLSRAEISPRTGWFSLPGEIRNQIMPLIFAPGHIYLRSKPTKPNTLISYDDDPDKAVPAPPGIQLLATCKQAYQEGHVLYYSSNVFHLPPGPSEVTRAVLGRFQPSNLALIRHVSFCASSIDLTPALMKVAEFETLYFTLWSHETNDRRLARHVLRLLDSAWSSKACFAATALPVLRTIQMNGPWQTIILTKDPGTFNSQENIREIRNILYDISGAAKDSIFCTIVTVGWESFKTSWDPEFVRKIESAQFHRHRCISRRTWMPIS